MDDMTLLVEVLEYRAEHEWDTKLTPKNTRNLTEYIHLLEKAARLYPTIETIRSDIVEAMHDRAFEAMRDIAGIGADYSLDA